jgi:two-component system sensor histidine kinase YesM
MLIQQMDIAFLQSQMNPHFLFNVLLSISARAKMDHDELLFEMVQSLTTLLQAACCRKTRSRYPFVRN